MNQLDVAALEKVVAQSSCWQGVILCANEDGFGEYNLLRHKAQHFRKTKCDVAGKEEGLPLSPHSRQRTYGILIPTAFEAIPGEWENVKQEVSSWAWNGGSIIVAHHFQHTKRGTLFEKTMRCTRCEPYAPSSSVSREVCLQ